MQASERLRALVRETKQAGYIDDTFATLQKVVSSLPLIADVVEAAEVYAPIIWKREGNDTYELNGIELRRRLTVLRDALEEK